jgi:hypothetical protein
MTVARSGALLAACRISSVGGAPAPQGVPALITACQAAGRRVVVFSTPTGLRFVDPAELEHLTRDLEAGDREPWRCHGM